MNEVLIKELIKCKLNAADRVINNLPPEISKEIKDLSRLILESINESCSERKENKESKPKASNKLENVPIE